MQSLTPPAPRKVRCPQCGAETPWSPANAWRPFCSERCRMIDLGAWASEAYRVPTQGSADTAESAAPEKNGSPGNG